MSLPTFCISIKGDTLYLTTKKVASRLVESLSTKTINFKLSHKEVDLSDGHIDEQGYEDFIDDYQVFPIYMESGRYIDKVEFYKILGITKFSDIFNKLFLEKWKLVIFVRNPKLRVLSGFVEITDSTISNYINDPYFEPMKLILIDYFKISMNYEIDESNFSFRELDESISFKILNKMTPTVTGFILRDEHTSEWTNIVKNLIKNIEDRVKIIDIDNKEQMLEFNFSSSESNKSIYQKWIDDSNNKEYVDNFFNTIHPLIEEELTAYNYLIKNVR